MVIKNHQCEIETDINNQVNIMYDTYKFVLSLPIHLFHRVTEDFYIPNIYRKDSMEISREPVLLGVMLACEEVLKFS